MKEIGKRLHELRKDSGLKLDYITYKAQISESCLYSWEKGQNPPTLLALMRLAKVYGCTLDYIANGNSQ